jgi:predicted acylesterase/phospholipase RssA
MNGLFTTRGIGHYLEENALVTNDFSQLGVDLFIVATQLNHSRKVIFGNFSQTTKNKQIKYANYASISDAVSASASLPPVFAPYGITNTKGKEIYFFDGEIRDTLSTHVGADHGADLVISSYSIQPYHYTEEMGSLHNYGIPLILNQALYQVIQQKIERHIKHQADISAIVKAVDGYCKQARISDEQREKLISIITERVQFHPSVDNIYIHPSPRDYEMFFVDHFSLNPQILGRIVKIGFKAAMSSLRQHNIL